jgi:hypothetical protein
MEDTMAGTSHTIVASGDVITKVRIDGGARATLPPNGSRGVNLGAGKHRITAAIAGQRRQKWSLKITVAEDDKKAVWRDSAGLPEDGLEILTDEFTV